jgi:signal peptidase I
VFTSQQNVVNDLIREEMAKGTTFCFRIISESMAPLIEAGDQVVVERASADRLRRGDIVLYTVDGTLHTHRLLTRRRHRNATLLVTKGDASLDPDQPWGEEQLLGKVVAVRREDRTIDLEGRKWRAVNRLLGILAALQVAALRVAHWVRMVIIGNRRTRWTALVARIVSAPSRLLIRLAGGSQRS